MKKILITGANGLLGKHVCRHFSKDGSKVFAIVRDIPVPRVSGVNYISLDLSKTNLVSNFPVDIDFVLHFAQSNRFKDFPDGAMDIFSVNVNSTHHLLEVYRKLNIKHFIYASSGGVYAQLKGSLTENSPILDQSSLGPYLGSKMCGEILVQNYSKFFTTSIVRPFFIYGPGQKRNMLLPRLYDSVINEKLISLDGKDGLRINPIHVDDVVQSIVALLDINKSSVYNLAGPQILSLGQISRTIGLFTNKKPIFTKSSNPQVDMIADNSLMKLKLHSPSIFLSDKIQDLSDKY